MTHLYIFETPSGVRNLTCRGAPESFFLCSFTLLTFLWTPISACTRHHYHPHSLTTHPNSRRVSFSLLPFCKLAHIHACTSARTHREISAWFQLSADSYISTISYRILRKRYDFSPIISVITELILPT